jgi:hypothetical protein
MTAVSPTIITALHPQQIGSLPLGRPGVGPIWHDTYDVRIRFGGHTNPGRWFALEAIQAQPATPDVDVLIGMDLLIRIDMVWLGSRRLILLTH